MSLSQDANQEDPTVARSRPLHRLFNQVTPRYDTLNRFFTLGLDQPWRRRVAKLCTKAGTKRTLDLCCGTADLALLMARGSDDELELTAVDFSETMIATAKKKAMAQGASNRIQFVLADASDLPFPDGYFDAIGIAFGFRNLTFANSNAASYMAEIRRVLAPEGRFVIVETSQPCNPLLRKAFHLYMRLWVGPLGGLISGRWGAYRYLAESASRFPPPDEIASQLLNVGFSQVEYTSLLGGITGVHVVWR
ncbi:ubiquinone/menaquinone biosynthesis methyltransferase [Candidatus Bipolaricaulota bacterium]